MCVDVRLFSFPKHLQPSHPTEITNYKFSFSENRPKMEKIFYLFFPSSGDESTRYFSAARAREKWAARE